MDLKAMFAEDQFAAQVGIELLEVREGFCRARLRTGPEHLNAVGAVQGGAIFTLADFAFAVAANSRGALAVTTEASISYVKAASCGSLVAEATEEAASDKAIVATVRVKDDSGEVVAVLKATGVRKGRGGKG